MTEERSISTDTAAQPAAIEAAGGAAPYWRYTLWAMVGIQFVTAMANSVLTPIMPLFLPELGVRTASGIDIWAGILSGITSFVAAFASPLWGSLADRHGNGVADCAPSVHAIARAAARRKP